MWTRRAGENGDPRGVRGHGGDELNSIQHPPPPPPPPYMRTEAILRRNASSGKCSPFLPPVWRRGGEGDCSARRKFGDSPKVAREIQFAHVSRLPARFIARFWMNSEWNRARDRVARGACRLELTSRDNNAFSRLSAQVSCKITSCVSARSYFWSVHSSNLGS